MFLYRLFFLYTCSWIVFIYGRKDTIKYKGIRRYLYKNRHKVGYQPGTKLMPNMPLLNPPFWNGIA